MLSRLMLKSELLTRTDPGNMVKRGHPPAGWSLRQAGFRAPSRPWRDLVAMVNWGARRAHSGVKVAGRLFRVGGRT
jgi:hypothetical protein